MVGGGIRMKTQYVNFNADFSENIRLPFWLPY